MYRNIQFSLYVLRFAIRDLAQLRYHNGAHTERVVGKSFKGEIGRSNFPNQISFLESFYYLFTCLLDYILTYLYVHSVNSLITIR